MYLSIPDTPPIRLQVLTQLSITDCIRISLLYHVTLHGWHAIPRNAEEVQAQKPIMSRGPTVSKHLGSPTGNISYSSRVDKGANSS